MISCLFVIFPFPASLAFAQLLGGCTHLTWLSDARRPSLFRNIYLKSVAVPLELIFLFFFTCVQQVLSNETALENPLEEVLSATLTHARAWFKNALSQKLLKEHYRHVVFTFNTEPEVCQLPLIRMKIFYCRLTV